MLLLEEAEVQQPSGVAFDDDGDDIEAVDENDLSLVVACCNIRSRQLKVLLSFMVI